MLMLAAIRNDNQKPLTRPPIQRQPNFKLLSFNTTTMTDRRSAAAKVINNADLLAHIASFMHFSSDPEQKAADDGYRLALLPSRSMLPSSRAKVMGVVSEWSTKTMLAYLIRRTAYIQRQQFVRPAVRETPVDLNIVASHIEAWLTRQRGDLSASSSRVLSFKLQQMNHLLFALQQEHSRWEFLSDPLFTDARDRLNGIAAAVSNNIEADSMRREQAKFDSKSKAMLEIIAAKLTDPPTEQSRNGLGLIQKRIEAWRKSAAKDYQLDDARVTNSEKREFYIECNARLDGATEWIHGPCDGRGMGFWFFFKD
jgi:hypothetical protein